MISIRSIVRIDLLDRSMLTNIPLIGVNWSQTNVAQSDM